MYINPNNLIDLFTEIAEHRMFRNPHKIKKNPIKSVLLKIFGDGFFGMTNRVENAIPKYDFVKKDGKYDIDENPEYYDMKISPSFNSNSVCRIDNYRQPPPSSQLVQQ